MSEINELDFYKSRCEDLEKENELLKRRIFGLETTVSNLRRKEERAFDDYAWASGHANSKKK